MNDYTGKVSVNVRGNDLDFEVISEKLGLKISETYKIGRRTIQRKLSDRNLWQHCSSYESSTEGYSLLCELSRKLSSSGKFIKQLKEQNEAHLRYYIQTCYDLSELMIKEPQVFDIAKSEIDFILSTIAWCDETHFAFESEEVTLNLYSGKNIVEKQHVVFDVGDYEGLSKLDISKHGIGIIEKTKSIEKAKDITLEIEVKTIHFDYVLCLTNDLFKALAKINASLNLRVISKGCALDE